MRSVLLAVFIALFLPVVHAQDRAPFDGFNTRRIQLSQRATWVLGGWATANLGAGLAVRANAERGSEAWHYGSMLGYLKEPRSGGVEVKGPSCEHLLSFVHTSLPLGRILRSSILPSWRLV